jgi:hypothetical protein
VLVKIADQISRFLPDPDSANVGGLGICHFNQHPK